MWRPRRPGVLTPGTRYADRVYIKEIRVENVRGFHGPRNVSLDLTRPDGSLAGWTVLAGRNGSGKTSLLRALSFAVGGPGVARNLIPDFAGWVSVGEPGAVAAVRLTHNGEFDRFWRRAMPDGPFWAGLTWDAGSRGGPGPAR